MELVPDHGDRGVEGCHSIQSRERITGPVSEFRTSSDLFSLGPLFHFGPPGPPPAVHPFPYLYRLPGGRKSPSRPTGITPVDSGQDQTLIPHSSKTNRTDGRYTVLLELLGYRDVLDLSSLPRDDGKMLGLWSHQMQTPFHPDPSRPLPVPSPHGSTTRGRGVSH